MGKKKHIDSIKELFEKSQVVDSRSIERLIKSRENVRQYHKQLIRNLLRQGRIKRLTKWYYTKENDPSLAVYCFKPAYLGLQDALSYHNLWEQETIPVILTSRRIRSGIRRILDSNVLIRRIGKKYMFGYENSQQDKYHLPYSDIEKTIIDMIHYNQNINNETLTEIKKRINKQKLKTYLKKYPQKTQTKTLNTLKNS